MLDTLVQVALVALWSGLAVLSTILFEVVR